MGARQFRNADEKSAWLKKPGGVPCSLRADKLSCEQFNCGHYKVFFQYNFYIFQYRSIMFVECISDGFCNKVREAENIKCVGTSGALVIFDNAKMVKSTAMQTRDFIKGEFLTRSFRIWFAKMWKLWVKRKALLENSQWRECFAKYDKSTVDSF